MNITELAQEILESIHGEADLQDFSLKAKLLAQMVIDNPHDGYFSKLYTERCQENLRLHEQLRKAKAEQKEKDAEIAEKRFKNALPDYRFAGQQIAEAIREAG